MWHPQGPNGSAGKARSAISARKSGRSPRTRSAGSDARNIGVPEAEGDRPPQGPERPFGLVLGRRRGAATALNLVAEGVPAGRGDPVEGITRIVRLEIAGRCIRRGRFLGAVPATTGGRQLDPAERALPAEIKVRGGCRDERLQGLRGRLELGDGRVDVPPERQGTAPVEQEGPSLAGGQAGDECLEVGAATERVEVGVLVDLTAVLVAGGQGLP